MRNVTVLCDICCREIGPDEPVVGIEVYPRKAGRTHEVAVHEWMYGDSFASKLVRPDVCQDCWKAAFPTARQS